MQLIIMRHGEAGWHADDRLRTLTDTGRQGVGRTARQLVEAGWRPQRLWCSTLARAGETAEIVGSLLGLSAEAHAFLRPDEDPSLAVEALQGLDDELSVMIVSHMPLVGRLTGLLVDANDRGTAFMTAQAVWLEMPIAGAGCAELRRQFLP